MNFSVILHPYLTRHGGVFGRGTVKDALQTHLMVGDLYNPH